MKKIITILFVSFCNTICYSQSDTIITVAGDGTPGNGGDGGPAISAKLTYPTSVAFDSHGNMYIASPMQARIRKVNTVGIISTYAGNGTAGFSGDNGPSNSAQLNWPSAVICDAYDNLYISDAYNHRIRKVDAITGVISTFVGNGVDTSLGDGGLATAASIRTPEGLAFDTNHNLFIAEYGGNRVRRVNNSGVITTIAGNGTPGFSGDGGYANLAQLYYPMAIAVDHSNNVYIADMHNQRIRKINVTTGVISTFAGNGLGNYNGENILAATAGFNPWALIFDKQGNLYIADKGNERIRKISVNGYVNTVAGNGISGYYGDNGSADSGEFYYPEGLALDTCGNIYIADNQNNRIRKIITNPTCAPDTTNPEEVKNITPINTITLYPNPAKDQLTVTGKGVKNITVLNALGQVLIQQQNYSDIAVVNVAGLQSGMYFIKVSDKSGAVVTKRFVKE